MQQPQHRMQGIAQSHSVGSQRSHSTLFESKGKVTVSTECVPQLCVVSLVQYTNASIQRGELAFVVGQGIFQHLRGVCFWLAYRCVHEVWQLTVWV